MLFVDSPALVVRVCVEPEGEHASAVRIESSVDNQQVVGCGGGNR